MLRKRVTPLSKGLENESFFSIWPIIILESGGIEEHVSFHESMRDYSTLY